MLPDLFTKLEEILEAGCQKHLEAGGTIIYGLFYDKEKGCCPVWASISSIDPKELEELKTTSIVDRAHYGLNKVLGFKISQVDMLGFVNGFCGVKNYGSDKMVYNLGQKFREKYIKEEAPDEDQI